MKAIFFVLVGQTLASPPQCTVSERNVWINNAQFSTKFEECSRRGFGQGVPTVNCLRAEYSSISIPCLTCFGQAAFCGFQNCATQCLANSAHPNCLRCIDSNCSPALRICVGAQSNAELPLPPVAASPTSAPVYRPRTRPPVSRTSLAATADPTSTETATSPLPTTGPSSTSGVATAVSSTSTEAPGNDVGTQVNHSAVRRESSEEAPANVVYPTPVLMSDNSNDGARPISIQLASMILIAIAHVL